MISSSFEGNLPEGTEPRPPDPEQTPRAPDPEASEWGVQDALQRILGMTLGPNQSVKTKTGDDASHGGGYGGRSGGSGSEDKGQQALNLLESSLVLNHMLSRPTKPRHQITIEAMSEDMGIERDDLVEALVEFLEADNALDDMVDLEDPKKEVDRIRALAVEEEIISWDSIPPEGREEEGVPRVPIDIILELTLANPWEWMGPLKEKILHISEGMQFLWDCVEELLALCQKVSNFSRIFAKRDELRYNLIKLGLVQLSAREVDRGHLKTQCFDILNLACALIEAFMENIAEECETGSQEDEGSEANEDSGEGKESRDPASSEAQSIGFQSENAEVA